LTAEGRPVG